MNKVISAADSLKTSVNGIFRRLDKIELYCHKSENFKQHMNIIKLYLNSIDLVRRKIENS